MKNITSNYKNNICKFGREIDSKITYIVGSEEIELGKSQLNSVSMHYEADILKSVMKQLDVDSNVDIPLGTEINYQFGLKVGNSYEYIDYGNYIVYSSEKQEDTRSYKIVCYDKMLYSMKDYESLGVTYPITIRNYISAICNKLGLTFANLGDTFPNFNREIQKELYLDENGNSLDYTFRDVLDELAQVTASIICINNNDALELRYIEQQTTPEFEIEGSTSQTGTPTPSNPISITCKTGNITETIQGQQYTFSLGNIKLDSLEGFTDRIYKSENKWYLEKNTTRLTINGSENWTYSTSRKTFSIPLDYVPATPIEDYPTMYADKIVYGGLALWRDQTASTYTMGFLINNGNLHVRNTSYTNKTNFQNWLSNNNIELLLPLATSVTTEITDETLLNQLNNVGNTADTIDKKYLKDINVNFGTKYGPINSVVLSRASESDNVFIQDEESIEENGLCEIKIKENQIMNFNDRADYLQDILDTLDGLEYYINDYSSTGITYYELGDKYNVSIDNNTYPCIMFNDEINITQGLEESIYTELPEKSETDYTKADKTDRKVNQTYIIADKQKGEIEALTNRTTILENETQNMYTIDQVNQLIINAETGVTNTFSEAGGNNIFRNTGLWFEEKTDRDLVYPSSDLFPSGDLFTGKQPLYEFWSGDVKKLKEEKASNQTALLLLDGLLEQNQTVPNGTYTISFKYNKLIDLSTIKCTINDVEYELDEEEETEFIQTIEVKSQVIDIIFSSDTDEGCEIYDLMVNAGAVKLAYSQNQNETTTDTVNISKGITITSSDTDTTFKANSDGIRIYDSKDLSNPKTKFTDKGTETDYLEAKEEAVIVDILIQRVGNHTWMTKI